MPTITSANSSFVLLVPGVFPIPINVQGYAVDDAFTTETVDTAEAVMGVDGKLSHGYTPQPTKLRVVLQPDSLSIGEFELWDTTNQRAKESFEATAAVIELPSVGKVYTFTKGALTRATRMPSAKKVLQPVEFEVTFESCIPAPLAI